MRKELMVWVWKVDIQSQQFDQSPYVAGKNFPSQH